MTTCVRRVHRNLHRSLILNRLKNKITISYKISNREVSTYFDRYSLDLTCTNVNNINALESERGIRRYTSVVKEKEPSCLV